MFDRNTCRLLTVRGIMKHLQGIAVLCASLALVGCMQYWEKPGSGQAEFDGMKAACNSRAYSRFPPMIRQVQLTAGHTTPVITNCNSYGNQMSCYSTGGQYVPPAMMPVDDNESSRSSDVQACFYENGWIPA